MVIQPAIEVNPVINAPSAQANRWWADSRQQGSADAQICGSLGPAETASREGIGRFARLIVAHGPASKPQAPQHLSQVDHNGTGRSAELALWRGIIEHEKLRATDRDVPDGQSTTPRHGHKDRFGTLYREQPFFLEVRRKLTERVREHCCRHAPLRQFQEHRSTIDLLNGIFSTTAGSGVFVANWHQQVQVGPVADMPGDAGRFLFSTRPMQDDDSFLQGVSTGLHSVTLESNDYP